jgi:hypothetical protein
MNNKQKTRRTKLDYEKADYIRFSKKTPIELSKELNCSRDAIYDVLDFKSWVRQA